MVFGKETSSSNRLWLMRRLSGIDSCGEEEHGQGQDHDCDHDGTLMIGGGLGISGDHSGNHSNHGSGNGSDVGDGDSPLLPAGGARRGDGDGDGDFLGVGDSDHVAGLEGGDGRSQGVYRGAIKRQMKPGPMYDEPNAGRGGGAGPRSEDDERGTGTGGRHKRSVGEDSHSAEGGAAKTDASAASWKKYKKGRHSESDELSAGEEAPVKSRNNSSSKSSQQKPRKPPKVQPAMEGDGGGGVLFIPGINGRRSKYHNPWNLIQAEALVDGVEKCGGGKWADIKKLGFAVIGHRTAVDLKDKWRNLLRIALLADHPTQKCKRSTHNTLS
jgi:hypothetical protein